MQTIQRPRLLIALCLSIAALAASLLHTPESIEVRRVVAAPKVAQVARSQPRSPAVRAKPVAWVRPAPKPAAKPAAKPVAPKGSVQARIAAAWPGDDAKVLRVVSCETGGTFDPGIRSRTGKFWGLFQADPQFRASYGYGPSVEQQVAMGWRGFQARGWSPWPVCGKR